MPMSSFASLAPTASLTQNMDARWHTYAMSAPAEHPLGWRSHTDAWKNTGDTVLAGARCA